METELAAYTPAILSGVMRGAIPSPVPVLAAAVTSVGPVDRRLVILPHVTSLQAPREWVNPRRRPSHLQSSFAVTAAAYPPRRRQRAAKPHRAKARRGDSELAYVDLAGVATARHLHHGDRDVEPSQLKLRRFLRHGHPGGSALKNARHILGQKRIFATRLLTIGPKSYETRNRPLG